ncbi:MAG TPA: tectonin domain-containing protein [Ktedonobacterales bacterium]
MSTISKQISRAIVVIVAALTLLGVTSAFTLASAHPRTSGTVHPAGGLQNTQAPPAPVFALSGSLPASVDLSAYNPPVGDQGGVNSCMAWATGYYLRGWYAKRDGYYPTGNSMNSFAPMYTYAQIVQGANAGTSFPQNLDIQMKQGLDSQSDYAEGNYEYSIQPSDAERTNASRYKIASYKDYSNPGGSGFETWIKTTLAGNNPIAILVPEYPELKNATATTSLIGVPTSGETSVGNHGMFAYGYDASGLLVENQWGTGWGNNGYAELSWDFVNKYGFEAVSIVPQSPPGTWIQLPGGATDISVGGFGSVWALGTSPVYGGYGIYHWNPTTWTWNQIPGGAVRIAVGPDDKPWVVNSFGNIFKWSGLTWTQVAGAARDIGVGADGSVWVVGYGSAVGNASAPAKTSAAVTTGTNTTATRSTIVNMCSVVALNPNDGGIFHLTLGGWQQIPGGANRIAVDGNGRPWIVSSCGAIYRWTGSAWQQVPGAAHDIGVGTNDVAWVTGTNAVGGGYQTYRYNGSGWDAIDGGATAISVGPRGNAWVSASDGTIWEYIG